MRLIAQQLVGEDLGCRAVCARSTRPSISACSSSLNARGRPSDRERSAACVTELRNGTASAQTPSRSC